MTVGLKRIAARDRNKARLKLLEVKCHHRPAIVPD